MNEMLKKLCEMLNEELKKIVEHGDINAGNLPIIDQLTHSMKSVKAVMAMAEGEYSNRGGYSEYSREGGYSRRRDSMGRYSREGGSYDEGSYDDGYDGRSYRGGYSRNEEGRGRMLSQMENLMMGATSEQEREALRQAVDALKRLPR